MDGRFVTDMGSFNNYVDPILAPSGPRVAKNEHSTHYLPFVHVAKHGLTNDRYGNTGYGVSKLARFLPKNQHIQRKLLNIEKWCNGEVSKSADI